MIPEFNEEGDLPPGVHVVNWEEFRIRFCGSSLKRAWLASRLEALLALARSTGKLNSIFVWGSFVTSKVAPNDIDILLVMDEGFNVPDTSTAARSVFDAARAKILFGIDIFWARASIGEATLSLWLETYQLSRTFRKRGILELKFP